MGRVRGSGKVNAKGGVVIPSVLRKEKNIKVGDYLAFIENEDGSITIKRISYSEL